MPAKINFTSHTSIHTWSRSH